MADVMTTDNRDRTVWVWVFILEPSACTGRVSSNLSTWELGGCSFDLILDSLTDWLLDALVWLIGWLIWLVDLLIWCGWFGWFDFIWFVLLLAWFISGFGYTLLLTPMGRVIRMVSSVDEFSQVYSAQFSLSHLCWLFMYPLSGYLMTTSGGPFTLLTLATLMVCSNIIAAWHFRSWKYD